VSEYAKPQFKLFSEVGKCETFPRTDSETKKITNVTADEDKIEKIKKRTQENKTQNKNL
jgi:hypothetical protein